MHTQVAHTSIRNYDRMRSSGQLGRIQQEIMAAIDVWPRDYSLKEIAESTGLAINTVSGRVNELRKGGQLEQAPQRACKVTGNKVRPVRRKHPQGDLF
ncbi:winged helix-turn-helix domain-containing protein [Cupriavidus sp. UBA2534]|uniref:winged helix-turn-helix domain-containing protein n=1 Tax=Cupriavidus sp. UBA2534 TaxID=1946399 RepID=UPI000E94AEFA|nr:winged helix-turn-helix domain-containing protein [Cupriavidus sp. UBA2534]HBO78680.1 hypothetical protein [Cupriavidus sp.]